MRRLRFLRFLRRPATTLVVRDVLVVVVVVVVVVIRDGPESGGGSLDSDTALGSVTESFGDFFFVEKF